MQCLWPVSSSVTHPARRAAGSCRPHCHGTKFRLCRCAASGLSSLPSLNGAVTGQRSRAAHSFTAQGVDCAGAPLSGRLSPSVAHWAVGLAGNGSPLSRHECWCPASGPLSHCLPSGSGPAGVDVATVRISTSRLDLIFSIDDSCSPLLPLRFSALPCTPALPPPVLPVVLWRLVRQQHPCPTLC